MTQEYNESLWVATSPKTDYPQICEDLEADVVVVGGGITGLTTALLLQREGIRTALLEANRVAMGTSGFTTGKLTALQSLTYATLEKQFGSEGARVYAEANMAAIEQVARLVEAYGIECDFERRSAYTYTTEKGQLAQFRAEVAAAGRAGLPAEFIQETELPFAVAGGVRLDEQAQFHARSYCLGLSEALIGAGGAIYEQSRVVDVEERGEEYLLRTAHGSTFRARQVVIATLLPILDRGGFFAKTSPARSYLLAYRTPGGAPFRGMYIAKSQPTRTLRSFGEWTIIGGENHKVGQEPDTPGRYAAIAAWAREHFGLEEPAFQWSSQDYMPLDHVPYVGRMPRSRDELMVATGFGKCGLTNGTVAAMILRDKMLNRENPWPRLYSSTRLDARNSARRFVQGNLDVARHFVSYRVQNPSRTRASRLAPGDGGIVKLDGVKVAAFRDQDGNLHTFSPNCPHMGCPLTWNNAEKSWDCPCHGSRFGAMGHYLQGPAVKDMKPKK